MNIATRTLPALALSLCVAASSCAQPGPDDGGDYYFVERAGATMPVWARGNAGSGVAIVFLHGGPGETAQYVHRFSFFRSLEERYLVAYWDQRCSGVSQGDPDPSTFTVEDFAKDLDLVVESVKARFGPTSVFLYGSSWGGALAIAYLSDPVRRAKVKGFIDEGGCHDMPLLLRASCAILAPYAAAMVAAGTDAGFWSGAAAFFAARADPAAWGLAEYSEYARYLRAGTPYDYAPRRAPGEFSGPDAALILASPMSFAAFMNAGALVPRFDILRLNLTPLLPAIDTPALLAWGRYDVNSPVAVGAEAVAALGGAPGSVSLRVFPDSGHNPFIDSPAEYLPVFIAFVEGYK